MFGKLFVFKCMFLCNMVCANSGVLTPWKHHPFLPSHISLVSTQIFHLSDALLWLLAALREQLLQQQLAIQACLSGACSSYCDLIWSSSLVWMAEWLAFLDVSNTMRMNCAVCSGALEHFLQCTMRPSAAVCAQMVGVSQLVGLLLGANTQSQSTKYRCILKALFHQRWQVLPACILWIFCSRERPMNSILFL